jgi:DNA (cytosine-5)-methyltransferase 1
MPEAAITHASLFPDAEFVQGDISNVRRFPPADLVVGGYPCQSFSLGGNRKPGGDGRTMLYLEFARCLETTNPKFFVAENVSGLKSLDAGVWLHEQRARFSEAGKFGYRVSWAVLRAEQFGVPQKRKRLFLVGVRKDLDSIYRFPTPTHVPLKDAAKKGMPSYESHGDAIAHLPIWPEGEFYERTHDPDGHWSWYYMSRNRKARWGEPSFTVVANLRHTPLHPASQTMRLVWSNLADGWKQKWEFSGEYEHTVDHPGRPVLPEARRLSWREAAVLQTFPNGFEPAGNLMKKFEQIGNAVPVKLAEAVIRRIVDGTGLVPADVDQDEESALAEQLQLTPSA